MDKISVIIPIYNRAHTLERCLASVCGQTYPHLEILCIDDKSTDNSLQLCYALAQEDSRIRVIPLEQNGGVSHARNTGLDNATGEWIAFVDSDDTIESTMLETMLTQANHLDVDLVLSDLEMISNGHNQQIHLPLQSCKYDEEAIKRDFLPAFTVSGQSNLVLFSFSTKLYKRELIENNHLRFNETIAWQEDKLFVIDVLANCQSVSYVNKAFYRYLIGSDGLYVHFNPKAWKWYCALYRAFMDRIEKYAIKEANIASVCEDFAYNITWFLYRSNRLENAGEKKSLQKEVISHPETQAICRQILPYLVSFDRRMVKAILSKNRWYAMRMIDFVYSGKKDKLLKLLKR